jgi:hypothetical protein
MNTNLNTITITLDSGTQTHCAAGTPVRDILPRCRSSAGRDYLGALVNNDAVSLSYPVEVDSIVTLLTRGDPHGFQIYYRSMCFLLAKTIKELFLDARFALQHCMYQKVRLVSPPALPTESGELLQHIDGFCGVLRAVQSQVAGKHQGSCLTR